MKAKKYYLGLSIFTGILCGFVFGEVELPKAETTHLLIAQPNPNLKGIKELYIIASAPINAVPKSHGLVLEEIENTVAKKIEESGIAVAETDIDKPEPNSSGMKPMKILKRKPENANVKDLRLTDVRIPELLIDVEAIDIKDSNQVVFYVRTSLARLAYLGRDNRPGFKTDVWQSEPIMRTASTEGMSTAVTIAALEQAEAFTQAYIAANTPYKRHSDVKNAAAAAKEEAEPADEPAPAPEPQKADPNEHKYVASKNGMVFHRPDCIWVKRIKPENLVYYSSREEAINAGKKPCKWCNP
jgi:hypothetical protein